MGLDDAFLIKQALSWGSVLARFWCWAWFCIEKIMHYNKYTKFTSIPIATGMWAWVNGFGLS
jgi:hypothetical protein